MGCDCIKDGKSQEDISLKLAVASDTGILVLNSTRITEIPSEALGMQLKSLECSGNKISSLPEDWMELVNLKRLYLSRNKLTCIPSSIISLGKLESLKLDHNKLTDLPSHFPLTRLNLLNVSHNFLTSLPVSLGNLSSLREIQASHNNFTHLPAVVSASRSLESVDFSRNKITSLPDDWKPYKLKLINLSYNPLTTLPSSLLRNSSVSRLILENTGVVVETVRHIDGYDAYERRHKERVDRAIGMNVESNLGVFS